jgi:hypothetical protein
MRGETLKGKRSPDKMIGIVKKIDAQGFGIIDGADGSKVPFIPDQPFAEHVIVMGARRGWSGIA